MREKLLRAILPLCCAGCMAAAPASAGAVTVGISDQSPAMFSSPLFQALKVHVARLMVPWNAAVQRNPYQLSTARAWLSAAQAAGIQPLVSFAGDGNYIPTVKQYSAAVGKFIKDFPGVKQYTPWNEPDWIYRPKLARHPALAAGYFNALHQLCPPSRGCTVVAGDVYLPANQLGKWLLSYRKALRYKPQAWALHPYDDVTDHQTAQIRTMEKYTSGAIWLDEISGVLHRGHWRGHLLVQSPAKAAQEEAYLFSLPKSFHRIARIYHYQWEQVLGTGWDSGLIASNGKPRPAYYVVKKAA